MIQSKEMMILIQMNYDLHTLKPLYLPLQLDPPSLTNLPPNHSSLLPSPLPLPSD